MQRILMALALALSCIAGHAEQTSRIDYPYLGIQFSVPSGWQGGESEEAYLMGSNTEPGLLAIFVNDAQTPADLKAETDNGIIDDDLQLARSSDFVQVGAQGLGAQFSGYADGQAARAFIIGLINPFGQGLTIAAITSKEQYSGRYQELALALANSVAFAAPKESEKTKEWRDWLKGRRLTYMYSSYSTDGSYYDASGQTYGAYSSMSRTVKIDLCSDGSFAYYSSSQSSFDNVGGFGGYASGDDTRGRWQAATLADGETTLVLDFASGESTEYDLSYADSKVYLDDTRYFGTDSEHCN